MARDDPDLVADLPLAIELVERSVELDAGYYYGAGHTFLGVVDSSRDTGIGGNPEKGREHFERALALTGRKALLVQLNYAQYYAVQKQDRALFLALMREVTSAPNPADSELTLSNTVARRRAERLLGQVDALILEPLPDVPAPSEPPAPAAEAAGAAESEAQSSASEQTASPESVPEEPKASPAEAAPPAPITPAKKGSTALD